MKRARLLFVAVTIILAGLVTTYFLTRPDVLAATIRLPIPAADAAFAPYYLAEDEGLFRSEGVDVALKPGGVEVNPVQTVSSGIDQFGILGGPELLMRARAQGRPLVAIVQLHKDGNFVVLVTKRSSGITNISDLRGRRVGFFYGHISTDVLRSLFARTGVNVQEVNVGFDYSQFIADRIPAQWAFRTTAGLTLPARGIEINMINPADYGVNSQGHILVTSEAMIRDHPELVQRVVDAVLTGARRAADDPSAASAATVRRDPQLPASVAAAQATIYSEAIRRNNRIGELHLEDMLAARDHLVVTGVPANLDVSNAFTNRFVNSYYERAATSRQGTSSNRRP